MRAGRAFCAGADLSGGAFSLPRGGNPATGEGIPADLGGRVTLRLYNMRKPVIGAVNGPAVGLGAAFLLPMDYRIASSTARLGFVFSRRGIAAESCSSLVSPPHRRHRHGARLDADRAHVDADEALAKRLVSEVVAQEELLPKASAIADNTAPASVALNRQLLGGCWAPIIRLRRTGWNREPSRQRSARRMRPRAHAPSWKSGRQTSPARSAT